MHADYFVIPSLFLILATVFIKNSWEEEIKKRKRVSVQLAHLVLVVAKPKLRQD
jgi:predicted transporter